MSASPGSMDCGIVQTHKRGYSFESFHSTMKGTVYRECVLYKQYTPSCTEKRRFLLAGWGQSVGRSISPTQTNKKRMLFFVVQLCKGQMLSQIVLIYNTPCCADICTTSIIIQQRLHLKIIFTETVRHVTGNDEDYLRKIPRVVVQKSALL
jgi:hypothetical protein